MRTNPTFLRGLAIAIALATVVTLMCGGVEVAVQQSHRAMADDPQIQIAEDAAVSRSAALAAVKTYAARYPGVDIAQSLSPWIAVYAPGGRPIASSARLDDTFPTLPHGVFANVKAHGEERVSWQPRPGVRSATIVTRTPTGEFVVSGRSLREVEKREDALNGIVASVWIAAMLCSIVAAVAIASRPLASIAQTFESR